MPGVHRLRRRGDGPAGLRHDREDHRTVLRVLPQRLPRLPPAQRGGQVFISSHSPDFLNALNLEEIYCLRKAEGFTQISRAVDSANLRALVDAGDLPGWLWKQGLLEGLN